MAELQRWHDEFMREHIEPLVLAKGEALLRRHLEAGDRVAIVTATNRFITGPIAARLGVETLLATECEMVDGRYTGRLTDIPCFQEIVNMPEPMHSRTNTYTTAAFVRGAFGT